MRILKSVTRCKDCDNRVYDFGVGFTANTTMFCGVFGCKVTEDDGCTFGELGEGGYAVKNIDVSIEGREAVNGYHYYYD